MTTRLTAGGLVLASAALAWLAVGVPPVARGLQVAVIGSMVYVAVLAWRGWRVMTRTVDAARPLPGVISFIVPARNEAGLIGATVTSLAVAAPMEDCEVLVVDDGSTDGTAERAAAAAAGFDHVRVLRREPGAGPRTKGAVLAWATPHVRGDIIGVIDADTRVDPAFVALLRRCWSRDRAAAALQVARRERNAPSGWLAGAQDDEQLMDLASQCGRWAGGGTAELRGNGMFVRSEVLDSVGGWSRTAITEDLELSTRLAAAGHHVALAPLAPLTEEAVETIAALWRQRLRWAEGSIRRLVEHGPRLVSGPLPMGRKLDFVAFTAEFAVPPLFVAAIVAGLATTAISQPADWTVPLSLAIGYGAGVFALALAGLHAAGERGPYLIGRAARGALFLSHWLVVVPVVLLRIVFGPATTEFVQTPRFGGDVP